MNDKGQAGLTGTMERVAEAQEATDVLPGWAIVELLGHRRLAGYVSEQAIADVKFLRIDVPNPGAVVEGVTQFCSPGSVYAITPATEDTARRAAASSSFRPDPVSLYEVGQAPIDADIVAAWLAQDERLATALGVMRQRDWIPTDDGANARKLVAIIRDPDLPPY